MTPAPAPLAPAPPAAANGDAGSSAVWSETVAAEPMMEATAALPGSDAYRRPGRVSDVGIKAMEVYVPALAVSAADMEVADGVPAGKYTEGTSGGSVRAPQVSAARCDTALQPATRRPTSGARR